MQKIEKQLHSHYNKLLFFAGICIFSVFKLLDFNGLYGQDAYEYYNYAHELKHFWLQGGKVGECHFPVFYPFIASFLSFILPTEIALQGISIACFMLTFYFLKKIINFLYPDLQYVSIYLFLFGILSPYFFRLGICIMSDMMAISAICGLIFYTLSFLKTDKIFYFTAALLCAFAAVMTRYASILGIFPPILAMIYHSYKNNSFRRIMPFFVFIFGLILLLIYLKKSYLQNMTTHSAYINWSFFNFFKSHFDIKGEGVQTYLVPNFIYGTLHYLHPAYLLLSPIFLFFIRKKDFKIPLFILLSATIYALFLMGFPIQNIRLQTFMMPFLLILFSNAFERFCHYFSYFQKPQISSFFIAFIFTSSLGLIALSTKSILHLNQIEKDICLKMNKIENAGIYTLGMEGALKAYQFSKPIHSLFNEKIDSLPQNSLFLLPPNFSIQWKGHLAMQNWEFTQKYYNLVQLSPLPNNWEIWKIESLK
jgi:hypothetical protein